jgi:hypothetical protein
MKNLLHATAYGILIKAAACGRGSLLASIVVIFGPCFLGNAQEKASFQITADSIRFYGDSDSKVISNNKLMEHVEIFKKVNRVLSSFSKSQSVSSQRSAIDSARIMCNKKTNTCEYQDLKKYGIRGIKIHEDGTIDYIRFYTSTPRHFTETENKFCHEKHRIPPTYCLLSDSVAIEKARVLLRAIIGEEDGRKFDSVSIAGNYKVYDIFLNIKKRNDICDPRRAEIVIHANTGEFESFYGPSKDTHEINYNYVPKISKSQVLQMYSNESIKLHADIVLSIVELVYKQIDEEGHHRWTWYAYGRRKDKHIGTAAMMAIDSETGEVLFKKLE